MLGAGHLPELIIILVVVVILFGAKRLPEVGAGMGKGIAEFRKSTQESGDEPQHAIPAAIPPATPVVTPRVESASTPT